MVRNEAFDYFSRRKKVAATHKAILNHEVQQADELCSKTDLDQIIDKEWKAHRSMLALQRIEEAFSKKTIQCFLEGMDGIRAAEVHWREFLLSLKKRGLYRVKLVAGDDHSGLRATRQSRLTGVP